MEVIEDIDLNKLLETAKKRNQKHWLIIKTFVETGISVSELIDLTPSNLTPYFIITEARTYRISQTLYKQLKQNSGSIYLFQSHKRANYGRYRKNTIIEIVNHYSRLVLNRNVGTRIFRKLHLLKKKTYKVPFL